MPRRQLEDRLKKEEEKRLDPNISPEEYRKSVAISLDMITNLTGRCWNNENPEDAAAIYQRHLRDANKVYDKKEVDKLLDQTYSPIKSAIDMAESQYQKDKKPLTNEDLWNIANKKYNTKKEVAPLKLYSEKQFADHKTKLMKDLFSYQTKRRCRLEHLYDEADKRAVKREESMKAQKAQKGRGQAQL